MLDYADDPRGRPGPRGTIEAAVALPIRALVYGDGIDMSPTCLLAPIWPCQVSYQL